jgi:quercetin dioxygenase-like cupin family protein
MPRQPGHYRWLDMPGQRLTPAIERRYLTGDHVTIARFELKQGGVVPRHSHDNEQVSCVLSGVLQFRFDDREVLVGAGELMQIPGGVAHEVHVLEDTVVMDVFSPVRQDWLAGTDTYFTRKD